MPFTSSKDTQYGDCYFDISQTEKRLVRAEERISLTLEEFGNLVKKAEKIREAAATQDSKPPPAKKQKFDQCSRDSGSNV